MSIRGAAELTLALHIIFQGAGTLVVRQCSSRSEPASKRRPSLWLRGAAFVLGMYAALLLTIGAVHLRHEASDELYHARTAVTISSNADTNIDERHHWLTRVLLVRASDYPRASRYPQIRQGRTYSATHTDFGIESPFVMPLLLIAFAAGSGVMLAIGRPWAKLTRVLAGIRQNEGPETIQIARILVSRRQHQASTWIWLVIGAAGGVMLTLVADFSAVWFEFVQGEVQFRRGIFTPPAGIPRAFLLLSVPDVLGVLCWAFFGCLLLSAIPGRFALRAKRRRLGTHCRSCGFPRLSRDRATDTACSECGSHPDQTPTPQRQRACKRLRFTLVLLLNGCLILFLASPHIVIALWDRQ